MDRHAARLQVLGEVIGLVKFWSADQVWRWHDPAEQVPESDRADLDRAAKWVLKGLEDQRAKMGER